MATAPDFSALASEYASRAGTNLSSKSNRTMVVSTTLVALLSFAGMISAAYTADHINRSACDKAADSNLKTAYKWSWVTAVIAGVTTAGMVGILVKTALSKKSE